MSDELETRLNGMFWDVGALAFDIPSIGDSRKAVFIYQQNRATITWHAMSTLERNLATLSQTAAILDGCTVGALDSGEVLQVANYGKAGRELMRLIRNDDFELTAECASHLHGFVGKEDAFLNGPSNRERRPSRLPVRAAGCGQPAKDRSEGL